MSPARMRAKRSSASMFARGGRATGTHGSTFRSGRSIFVSSPASSRSIIPATGYTSSSATRSPCCSRSRIPRDIVLDTSRRVTSPKRRRRSSTSTASSRSSASSETSRSASRVTRKTELLDDLHAGKERRQEVHQHLLERHVMAVAADREEARKPLGNLHAREALLAGLGIAGEHGEADRERRDVRERLPRARRRAVSAPGRSRARTSARAAAAPPARGPRRRRRRSPLRREPGRAPATRPVPGPRTARTPAPAPPPASAAPCGRRASGRSHPRTPGRSARRREP